MRVRLTQIDGKLPNLALMKLARFHRERGDDIHFSKRVDRDMIEPGYDRVYGSAIFSFSNERVRQLIERLLPGLAAQRACDCARALEHAVIS